MTKNLVFFHCDFCRLTFDSIRFVCVENSWILRDLKNDELKFLSVIFKSLSVFYVHMLFPFFAYDGRTFFFVA